MKEIIHNKLVRDKIPEFIRADGQIPTIRTLDNDEHLPASLAKVDEETKELRDSDGELGEVVDVIDAALAVAAANGYSEEQVMQARQAKLASRGGFTTWTFLEKVTAPDE